MVLAVIAVARPVASGLGWVHFEAIPLTEEEEAALRAEAWREGLARGCPYRESWGCTRSVCHHPDRPAGTRTPDCSVCRACTERMVMRALPA